MLQILVDQILIDPAVLEELVLLLHHLMPFPLVRRVVHEVDQTVFLALQEKLVQA